MENRFVNRRTGNRPRRLLLVAGSIVTTLMVVILTVVLYHLRQQHINTAEAIAHPRITAPSVRATKRVTIMPLGDSITLGQNVEDIRTPTLGGYRTKLWQLLGRQRKYIFDFVGSLNNGPASLSDKAHEGHSGWCIAGPPNGCFGKSDIYLANAAPTWVANYHPDVILMHAGTNDIKSGFSGQETASHLDTMLKAILGVAPKTHIFVATIIEMPDGLQPQAEVYNQSISAIVNRYTSKGYDLDLVNMSHVLSHHTSGDFSDDVHPTDEGYKKMAGVWYGALSKTYSLP